MIGKKHFIMDYDKNNQRDQEAFEINDDGVLVPKDQNDDVTTLANEDFVEDVHIVEPEVHDNEDTSATSIDFDNETDEFVYTSEWLKENTSIGGWLTFFLFSVGLSGITSLVMFFLQSKVEVYGDSTFLFYADALFILASVCLAGYIIYAFINRKPNAVFWARIYLAFLIINHVLTFIGESTDGPATGAYPYSIRAAVICVIWLFYTVYSSQVEEIIPKEFRRISKHDWIVFGSWVFFYILTFVIGFMTELNKYSEPSALTTQETLSSNQTFLTKLDNLSENQRSDGTIIFKVPQSFVANTLSWEKENTGKHAYFELDNEKEGIMCQVFSDYDTNDSQSNFNSYWKNWKDDSGRTTNFKVIDEGKKLINGNKCFYKITRFSYDGVMGYWNFLLLFDKETGKVALIQSFDDKPDGDYIDELLYSIEFK